MHTNHEMCSDHSGTKDDIIPWTVAEENTIAPQRGNISNDQSSSHHVQMEHPPINIDKTDVQALSSVTLNGGSNLKESMNMQREMRNQMAFQNKLRALKQQELDKYQIPETNHVGPKNDEHGIESGSHDKKSNDAEVWGWNVELLDDHLFDFMDGEV
eukprot:CAMPEP_0194335002 /NCGR_PEP_ID=MMETSP0171-20130528/68056_1 /TAXON_ID=218684 /ORGANISM="Corethron pennatum, Strain L29A3" /LENGTH=156 /DNA_ID=CAMNT_0039097897 /DNA_START=248 /DNA_END=718 /DNA_ORIENTATION=-